jgi:hypothetical protein
LAILGLGVLLMLIGAPLAIGWLMTWITLPVAERLVELMRKLAREMGR